MITTIKTMKTMMTTMKTMTMMTDRFPGRATPAHWPSTQPHPPVSHPGGSRPLFDHQHPREFSSSIYYLNIWYSSASSLLLPLLNFLVQNNPLISWHRIDKGITWRLPIIDLKDEAKHCKRPNGPKGWGLSPKKRPKFNQIKLQNLYQNSP